MLCLPLILRLNFNNMDFYHNCIRWVVFLFWISCLRGVTDPNSNSTFAETTTMMYCNPGTYGPSCEWSCHCHGNENCHIVTGHCAKGCEGGWGGLTCGDFSSSLLYCQNSVRNFSLLSGTNSLLMSETGDAGSVDYHLKSKILIWADNNDKINKAPLWQVGARPSDLVRGFKYSALAVDWIHNLIYWTEYYNRSIVVSRLDGSMVRTIFKVEGTMPFGIALNPAEGFMFWTDFGKTKKIERCNMDGTKSKVIVTEDIDVAYSLAIDFDSQRIYWVDFHKYYLCSSKFDGNHRRNLITQLKNPRSIDIYGQHVYIVASGLRAPGGGLKAIYTASKVDGSGLTKLFDGQINLLNLKVLDPSKQLEGYDVCGDDNGGCSHLCLPTSGHTFSCACPNDLNMSSDNFTCLNSEGFEVTAASSTTYAPSSQLSLANFTSSTETNKNVDATIGSSCTYELITGVIYCVTVMVVVVMWIHFRRLSTRTSNEENNFYMEGPL